MSAPSSSSKLPRRTVRFATSGALGGLLAALALGEPLWYLLAPKPTAPAAGIRPAPLPAEKPPKVAISLPPRLSVYPGGKNTFSVAVARERHAEPIAITFEFVAPGPTAERVTVPAEATTATAELLCTPDVKPGIYALTARAGDTAATAEVEVLSPAGPPPRMGVSAPPKVQVYQRGKNTGTVRVARADFAGAVTVAFTDLPAGVVAAAVTVPAGSDEATFELTADSTAKPGTHPVKVAASAPEVPRTTASATVEVLPALRAPVDVVIVQDITGSMRKELAGTRAGLLPFADVLTASLIDLRLGFIGFKDTTLGQPLRVLTVDDATLTADFEKLRAELAKLEPRGGGLEGASSLDGLAAAAEFPFRDGARRVLVLVTDDGPKRPDGRIKTIEEAAELLKKQKIDQLHIVTLPEWKDALAPLWEGAKGKFFSLTAGGAARDEYDAILLNVGRDIAERVGPRPVGKPEPPAPAAPPVAPPLMGFPTERVPPPSPEPPEPTFAPDPPPASDPEPEPHAEPPERRRVFGVLAWLGVVVAGAGTAGAVAARRANPGLPGGVVVAAGLAGGALLAVGFGNPIATRLGYATFLGLGCGFVLAFARRGSDAPVAPEPPAPAPVPVVHRPVIAAPKKPEGCPGCGRFIPGDPGSRYCMLCDRTF